ncbi:nitrogenase, partial [Peptococcaceae bacterium]|nr:nitrogenase [Peptococcaceae bacterium]
MNLIAIKEQPVVINPCKACQPIGAMYATLGIERAVPLVQGAQGCSTFVRYQFNRHFREPANIAVTSFHEDAVVFGGRRNLIEGIINLVQRYHPAVIGVVTTCSSETIGDDIDAFIKEAKQRLVAEIGVEKAAAIFIVGLHTPSYAGSHVQGYDNGTRQYLEQLAQESKPNQKLNIIPGMINPGDIAEIKHLLAAMGVAYNMLFDISETLNAPLKVNDSFFPDGGTPATDLVDAANSLGTVALSRHAGGGAATYLWRKFNVPVVLGPLPVGIYNTDLFLEQVAKLTGQPVTAAIKRERGLLLDAMADTCSTTALKKVAIFGDPDTVLGVTRFTSELGMEPVVLGTTTASKEFDREIALIAKEYHCTPQIVADGGLHKLEQVVLQNQVEMLIGNSKGATIAKQADIPLVRIGFPVTDRVGYQRRPVVGYNGSLWLLDQIVNAFLERK